MKRNEFFELSPNQSVYFCGQSTPTADTKFSAPENICAMTPLILNL